MVAGPFDGLGINPGGFCLEKGDPTTRFALWVSKQDLVQSGGKLAGLCCGVPGKQNGHHPVFGLAHKAVQLATLFALADDKTVGPGPFARGKSGSGLGLDKI